MKTIDKAASSAHEAVDKVASVTNQAAETLGEKGQQLKKTERQLMENCCGYVRENPVTSMGIAVVAGFLLSRLLNRP